MVVRVRPGNPEMSVVCDQATKALSPSDAVADSCHEMAIPRRIRPRTDARPLREILAERKELIAKYVPPETQAIHARAVAELKERQTCGEASCR